ncbi:BTAD domain-containing putative transcriptional regulator [Nonomuraea sp. NPDC050328]|uniref:BTAD domain-containing putative transcriptional regulator n=1 Tax=Nonomuraea sp. NPDC050328 TaxID=3364361 RepID=UPI0037941192
MRFGVLGPLEVHDPDGRPVRIPEVKVRTLLAALVVEAGRVVPADRLIDHLWPGRLPASPTGALQTRVSQLRRALGRDLVVWRAPGYVLDVPADAVDSLRFQSLVVQARALADPAERARLLAEALGLWRGEALPDFADEEFAAAEIARLTEVRLTALEEWAEARLDLGEHQALADELGDLVARHPLRERLRAVHLRALYRAGRQNEALDGYREVRERLADELGVDPGPQLTALYQAILAQDPDLEAPAAPAGNLPVPLTPLVGRAETVSELGRALAEARLVTLTGPGGVGKTRLALEVGGSVSGFTDGVWLAELSPVHPADGSATPDLEVLLAETVSAALRLRDESAAAPGACAAERLAESLRGKRMLLILDNCEHVIEAAAHLAARLLGTAPDLRILATSQRPLGLAGELLRQVQPLAEPAAAELFAQRAQLTLDAGTAAAVATICRHLDGLPLALELAATRVRALGVQELAARLEDRFQLLTTGHTGAPARQRTLRAMIDWSWSLLGDDERTLLRRLAVQADGSTLRAVEQIAGETGLDVLTVLPALVDRSLVALSTVTEPPRYRLLESVAAYASERLREAGEDELISSRHRAYYAGLAVTAEPYLRGPEQRHWLAVLDAETGNLRLALDSALRHGEHARVLAMVNALAWYWVLRGRLGEGRRWLTIAAGFESAGLEPARRVARLWLAAFSLRVGELPSDLAPGGDSLEPAEASLEVARASLEPARASTEVARASTEVARASTEVARAEWFLIHSRLGVGDQPELEETARRTLAAFTATADRWGTAAVLSTMARQAMLRGDLVRLAQYGEQSRALFEELGDRWGLLYALSSLGSHAEITGDYVRAERMHREALRLAEELALGSEAANQLAYLGRIALLTGDHAKADDLHGRASRLAAEQGYVLGEEFADLGLALSARRQGRLDEAEAYLLRWLGWDRRLGSDAALSLILAELGFVAEQRGELDRAAAWHEEGLAAARKTGDPRALALALEGLAGVRLAAGDPAEAARLLGTAAAHRASVGAPLPEGERFDVSRITAAAVAALGESRFTTEQATPPHTL